MKRVPSLGDLTAGLSVALVLIPQSLAYAELAGMPPYVGLYAAGLPPLAAAFFASSPYLQTGPVALTALLTHAALVRLASPGSAEFIRLGSLLALLVGLVRLALGVMRSGRIAYMISQPVLYGFTSAAAALIIASQIPIIAGVQPPVEGILEAVIWTLSRPGSWEWISIGLAAMALLLVAGGRGIHAFLGVPLAVGLGVLYSRAAQYAGPVIGNIPWGLPVALPNLPWTAIPALLLPASVIALVGFAEPASIARTYATIERRTWDANRELISQGVANLASAVSGGFPVGGSFSRSALARLAGAATRWSGAVAGATVLLLLPFVSVLSVLPKAVLGAIVMAAVVGLVQIRPLFEIRRYSRRQFLVGVVTFLTTLAASPHIEWGVIVGVTLAMAVHLRSELVLTIEAGAVADVVHLHPRGVLWFGSVPAIETSFLELLSRYPEASRVAIHMGGLGRVDLTGALALRALMDDAKKAGVEVEIVEVPSHAERLARRVLQCASTT